MNSTIEQRLQHIIANRPDQFTPGTVEYHKRAVRLARIKYSYYRIARANYHKHNILNYWWASALLAFHLGSITEDVYKHRVESIERWHRMSLCDVCRTSGANAEKGI